MIVYVVSIVFFNIIAFTLNKRLTKNQIIMIWLFTISFQAVTESFIDFKYHGYWYFTKEINWWVLPAFTLLIPPVNILFLNWYPFEKELYKRILYIFYWTVALTTYEALAILPEPWGYFRHGWWRLSYSAVVYPILLFIVIIFYKWVRNIEDSD